MPDWPSGSTLWMEPDRLMLISKISDPAMKQSPVSANKSKRMIPSSTTDPYLHPDPLITVIFPCTTPSPATTET